MRIQHITYSCNFRGSGLNGPCSRLSQVDLHHIRVITQGPGLQRRLLTSVSHWTWPRHKSAAKNVVLVRQCRRISKGIVDGRVSPAQNVPCSHHEVRKRQLQLTPAFGSCVVSTAKGRHIPRFRHKRVPLCRRTQPHPLVPLSPVTQWLGWMRIVDC